MSLGAIQLNKIEYLLINAVELKIFCNEDVLKFVPIESCWLLSGNLSCSLFAVSVCPSGHGVPGPLVVHVICSNPEKVMECKICPGPRLPVGNQIYVKTNFVSAG